MKSLLITLVSLSFLISGCTTQQKINRLEPNKVHLVCVVEHKEVKENVLETIQEGLRTHGVDYKVIPGQYKFENKLWIPTVNKGDSAGCDALLFYVANWTWDITMYMHFANIWMATPDMQIRLGDASYDARLSMNKFINARAKILELVDGLFVQYRNPNAVSATDPVQKNSVKQSQGANSVEKANKSNSNSTTAEKLRELQSMKNEGLISEQDYERKKKQLLEKMWPQV